MTGDYGCNGLTGAVPSKRDDRDHVKSVPSGRAQPAADLARYCLPVMDQGRTNACTGFAEVAESYFRDPFLCHDLWFPTPTYW